MLITGVAVEKLAHSEFAKIGSRQKNRLFNSHFSYHHQSQNEAVIWNFAYLLDCQKPGRFRSHTVIPSFSAMPHSILHLSRRWVNLLGFCEFLWRVRKFGSGASKATIKTPVGGY
jgi:hypothetical protein